MAKKFTYDSFAFPNRNLWSMASQIPGTEKGATYAYDHHLPCLNPQCKSHGKPHPNCRCYGMSEGGEVGHYCSEERPHEEGCEYFAGGGEVVIPDSEVVVDQEIPDSDVIVDQEIPDSDVLLDSDKYSTPMEQFKTAAEGAAQGIAGPLATWAETKILGVDPEDIRKRQEANPIIHGSAQAATMVGGLLTGTGLPGMIAKGAGAISKAATVSKLGAAALAGAIETASFTGSDEITKAMIGKPGSDPEEPVSAALLHVGAAGVMGSIGGGVFKLGEKLIGKASPEIAKRAEDFLYKIGADGDPLGALGLSPEGVASKMAGTVGSTVGGVAYAKAASIGGHPAGAAAYQVTYGAVKNALKKPIEKIVGRHLGPINERVYDGVIKAIMTNEAAGVSNAIHYARQIERGVRLANDGMDSLFKAGSSKIAPKILDTTLEEFKGFIQDGQVEQQLQNSVHEMQPFAKGGMVSSDGDSFSKVFPEQNMLLNTAKGRVSGYLNSIRPMPGSKLPFDRPVANAQAERNYTKAIKLAIAPLRIIDKMNNGRLTPDDMRHFTAMYPEVHKYLSTQITKKITEAQLKGDMPPYRKRQSMSLFLGASLDTTFTPMAIQAAQMTFAPKQQPQMPQKGQKGSTKALSKTSNSYLTPEQSREKRMQNQRS